MLRARASRWVPFLNRYAEMAPACCNACRTCTTTNVLNLAALVGGMAAAPVGNLLHHLQKLVIAHGPPSGTDRQLLDDFLLRQDEAAFAVLLARVVRGRFV